MHLHTSVQQCNEMFTFSQELEKYSSSQKWLKIKLLDFLQIIFIEQNSQGAENYLVGTKIAAACAEEEVD